MLYGLRLNLNKTDASTIDPKEKHTNIVKYLESMFSEINISNFASDKAQINRSLVPLSLL